MRAGGGVDQSSAAAAADRWSRTEGAVCSPPEQGGYTAYAGTEEPARQKYTPT